jgi:hypothetical protein
MSKGHNEEAWTVLVRLRKCPTDPEDLIAREEYHQIKKQLELDAKKLEAYGGSPWKAVFKKKSYRKRMIIGFMTQWGAEFGGPLIIVSLHLHGRAMSLTQLRITTPSFSILAWDKLATCPSCSQLYG